MTILTDIGETAANLPVIAWALVFIAAAQPSVRDFIDQNRDEE